MSKKSEAVKRWRKNIKRRIIQSLGGRCVICGYDHCDVALDCHHLIPDEKEIGISAFMARPQSWDKIAEEVKKCILLCNRCHAEIHCGITTIPENPQRFDENLIEKKEEPKSYCPICGSLKKDRNITCSRNCAAKKSRKVDWGNVDLGKLLIRKENRVGLVADELGISDSAVRKRMKKLKLGIYSPVV